jgi:adenine phosphoribosyltransferase
MDLAAHVRTIPNFPKPGIMFRDISTLVNHPDALRNVVDRIVERYQSEKIEKVVAIDSRGFIVGGAIACRLGVGLVMARKPGKLPGKTLRQEYQLEYGKDAVEIHVDAVSVGQRCLVVDDLLATGGTAEAASSLVEKAGGVVVGCAFVINLPELGGDARLKRYDPFWLIDFPGH